MPEEIRRRDQLKPTPEQQAAIDAWRADIPNSRAKQELESLRARMREAAAGHEKAIAELNQVGVSACPSADAIAAFTEAYQRCGETLWEDKEEYHRMPLRELNKFQAGKSFVFAIGDVPMKEVFTADGRLWTEYYFIGGKWVDDYPDRDAHRIRRVTVEEFLALVEKVKGTV